MKIVHWVSAAGVLIALALFLAGSTRLAVFVCGLATVVEIAVSAIYGKKTNEGER